MLGSTIGYLRPTTELCFLVLISRPASLLSQSHPMSFKCPGCFPLGFPLVCLQHRAAWLCSRPLFAIINHHPLHRASTVPLLPPPKKPREGTKPKIRRKKGWASPDFGFIGFAFLSAHCSKSNCAQLISQLNDPNTVCAVCAGQLPSPPPCGGCRATDKSKRNMRQPSPCCHAHVFLLELCLTLVPYLNLE